MSKRKVTFFIGSLLGGGAEGVCVSIANGLAAKGWSVTLLVLHENNAVYQDRVNPAVRYEVLGCKSARHAMLPLRRWLTDHQPDKVVVFNHGLAALLVAVRMTSTVSFHIIARNINTLSQKIRLSKGVLRRHVINPVMYGLFRRVDFVINQCNGMKTDLLEIFPELAAKTCVIYNPINAAATERAAAIGDPSTSPDSLEDYILCVGRLNEQKAFHYAIRAFAVIAPDYPCLRLKLLGQGPLENELKHLADELGIRDRVDFHGFESDIWDYYVNARLTLLTSAYEGFPNVLLESIALGTPIVAFDCPHGPAEIVQPQENGCLVAYQHGNELVLALRQVLDSAQFTPQRVQQTSMKFHLSTIIDIWDGLLKSPRFS